MPHNSRIVAAGPTDRSVRLTTGEVLVPPADWALLPPGDPGLTRRVKATGATWTVQEKRGRKVYSLGVWAPAERIEAIRIELTLERQKPQYAKRQQAQAKRREQKQVAYVGSFRQAVLDFLAFAPAHAAWAERLADAVTKHATPLGSGTVARTERISIEERAEAAVIAWMRHQTTAYDGMSIPRVKGKRREIRRLLADKSRQLLKAYRVGDSALDADCPLQKALDAHR